jgi:serine/threonine protein kinase
MIQLMEQQQTAQLLGSRFEQYEQIGHGSFGSVYRGWDTDGMALRHLSMSYIACQEITHMHITELHRHMSIAHTSVGGTARNSVRWR